MGSVKNSSPEYSTNDSDFQKVSPIEKIERIMEEYGDEIKRLIFTYVKNESDTEDVTQEVFLTIYQKLHTYKGESSLKSWLYSIAINKCKDHLRSWKYKSEKLLVRLMETSHIWNITRDKENPINLVVKQNDSEELLNQLMNLPVKYREILILYYFKELSTKEIAYTLDIKEATIRTRLIRGRDRLKIIMQRGR